MEEKKPDKHAPGVSLSPAVVWRPGAGSLTSLRTPFLVVVVVSFRPALPVRARRAGLSVALLVPFRRTEAAVRTGSSPFSLFGEVQRFLRGLAGAERRVAEPGGCGLCWDPTVAPLNRVSQRAEFWNQRLVVLHVLIAGRRVRRAGVGAVGLPVYGRGARM